MSFRLVSKSVTLNDLERRNGRYFALFQRIRVTNSGAHCVKVHVRYLISWWVLVLDGKSQIPLRYLVGSWSVTSFEPASVMEFGFKNRRLGVTHRHHTASATLFTTTTQL